MIRQRRTTITREGLYYLLVLTFVVTGSVLREINLLMVMAGMMLGPLLLSWRMAVVALRPLKVSRWAPRSIGAGEQLVVDVTLRCPASRWLGPGAWAVIVEDTLRPARAERRRWRIAPAVFFWRVAPGESRRVSYRGQLMQRGSYRLGPLTLSTRYPLGLLRRTVIVEADHELTVLPRLGHLTPAWNRFYQRAFFGGRGRQVQSSMLEGDFHSLRDWRSGDARRQIHWRTTARRRTPVIRLYEQQRSRDLVLLVDLWAGDEAGGRLACVERAISFAATVVDDVCRRGGGTVVLALCGSTRTIVRGAASSSLMAQCLAELAVTEAGNGDQLQPLLNELGMIPSGSALLLLSTRAEELSSVPEIAEWCANPRGRGFSRVLTLDTIGAELSDYFTFGENFEPAKAQS